jgi:hypothetical protein
MPTHRVVPAAALILIASIAEAQQLPPVRALGTTVARSTEPMGSVSAAVPLPGGKVLVNDILGRRVLLFDSTLSTFTIVADSTSSTANAYGGRTGGLLHYRGDSALFVDPASMSMLVIKPNGEIGRVMSAPRPQDVGSLIGGPNGIPGFDAMGRMVYREPMRPTITRGRSGGIMPEFPDSVPIVRFDLAARKLDTVAFMKVPKPNIRVTETASGGMSMTSSMNPIPTVDDWALLSDGSVAIVHGTDYSIDWISPDGTRSSSGKVPYEWQRLDEDAKYALLDSARTAIEKQREMARQAFENGTAPPMVVGPGGMAGGGDVQIVTRMGATEAAAARGRAGGGRQGGQQFTVPPVNLVNADELPDYRPPFTTGAARGDNDGSLWVRTTSPVGNAGPIYFVINRQGQVIDRVQVPEQRLIVGFGRDGDVFLALRDAEGRAIVERAKVR